MGNKLTFCDPAPVPTMIVGRFAELRSEIASETASGCGPGGYGSGDVMEPHEMRDWCTGEKRMSMGKSIKTRQVLSKLKERSPRGGRIAYLERQLLTLEKRLQPNVESLQLG